MEVINSHSYLNGEQNRKIAESEERPGKIQQLETRILAVHGNPRRRQLGRGSNELGSGSNDLGRGININEIFTHI